MKVCNVDEKTIIGGYQKYKEKCIMLKQRKNIKLCNELQIKDIMRKTDIFLCLLNHDILFYLASQHEGNN